MHLTFLSNAHAISLRYPTENSTSASHCYQSYLRYRCCISNISLIFIFIIRAAYCSRLLNSIEINWYEIIILNSVSKKFQLEKMSTHDHFLHTLCYAPHLTENSSYFIPNAIDRRGPPSRGYHPWKKVGQSDSFSLHGHVKLFSRSHFVLNVLVSHLVTSVANAAIMFFEK